MPQNDMHFGTCLGSDMWHVPARAVLTRTRGDSATFKCNIVRFVSQGVATGVYNGARKAGSV